MYTATLVQGWAQMQGAPLFPFPLSQEPFLASPFPHSLSLHSPAPSPSTSP